MKIASQDAERHATAQAELQRIAAEEEARRHKILADLTRARTIEDTRTALGTLLAAVTTAYLSLADPISNQTTTTTSLEAVYTATNDLRRAPRTTRTSTTPGTAARTNRSTPRPLRPEVAAHLNAHPHTDFTPGDVAKALNRSSGAIANALDRLVQTGQAELANEKPHRYRATTPRTPPKQTDLAKGRDLQHSRPFPSTYIYSSAKERRA